MKEVYVSTLKDESEKILKLAKEMGLGFEVQSFIQPYSIGDYNRKLETIRCKLEHIQQVSLHGPFVDLFTGSRDPKIVEVVKSRFWDAYYTARSIKAKHLIFHAGYVPKAFFPIQWLETSAEFWKDYLESIDHDVEIHIENVCEDQWGTIAELIEVVDSPRFSACLDIGHANVNSSVPLEQWIKGLNKHIKYVHLHNNYGISDNHYGLCNGDIDILKTLELLEIYAPDAKWSLETKLEETEESILFLSKNGFIE
ncbi:sugar phosphate isomerase/epimerase family protein [Clostridium sp. UBA4548]|uniref:sugar phosphate isomerase/epimerase family protein n=1 Tax=Clostridium sp. UBA4548 TaxID=1946361 RepID=UPI0025C2F15F|nr:TIM barrel protein [Clostridium sp. UBA4548]